MQEGNEDSAHLSWALKARQSELPALGPGKAEPEEDPRTTMSGQWVNWISLLKPSLFAWLLEEGSYPSKSRAISQSSLKQVFQPRELELKSLVSSLLIPLLKDKKDIVHPIIWSQSSGGGRHDNKEVKQE